MKILLNLKRDTRLQLKPAAKGSLSTKLHTQKMRRRLPTKTSLDLVVLTRCRPTQSRLLGLQTKVMRTLLRKQPRWLTVQSHQRTSTSDHSQTFNNPGSRFQT